jgi:Ca2+-binding RTX toxin-like protein
VAIFEGTSSDDSLLGGSENDSLYGYKGNDELYGLAGDDKLFGGDGNDRLYGGEGKDHLYGQNGSDTLLGGEGNDRLYGESGDDSLYGFRGNDILVGGSGNDLLNGAGVAYDSRGPQSFGTGEIDTLTGGSGKDTFQLWGGSGRAGINVYYDDLNATTAGITDYALITDFKTNEDVIQLTNVIGGVGAPPQQVSYILGASPSGLPTGTGIFIDKPSSEPNELIAILQGVSPDSLSLNGSYFSYYS